MNESNVFYTLYYDGKNAYQANDRYYYGYDDLARKFWRNEMIECGAKWAHIFDSDGKCVDSF